MKGYSIAIIFIVGLALGIAGMFYGPKYLGEYMPGMSSFGMGSGKPVEGKVAGKLHRAGKLLITVSTPDGASLVTFNQKVDEIALLVDVGDQITLKMGKYRPFVTNPAIVRVRKGSPEFGGNAPSMAPLPPMSAPPEAGPAPPKQEKNKMGGPAGKEGIQNGTHPDQSTSVFGKYRYIGHAFGGIDGHSYTNSLEAFNNGYKNGRRLFEVDLSQIADGSVVAFHDQHEKAYGFDKNIAHVTHKEFRSARILGKYTTVDLDKIISLMHSHPDMYIITDTKGDFHKILSQFVWKARLADRSIADRIIPQIYHERDYADAMGIYPFKEIIYTLYRTGADDNSVVAFLKANKNITGLTVNTARFHEGLARRADALGRYVFVHTLNSKGQMQPFVDKGAYGFYTDFYYPKSSAITTSPHVHS